MDEVESPSVGSSSEADIMKDGCPVVVGVASTEEVIQEQVIQVVTSAPMTATTTTNTKPTTNSSTTTTTTATVTSTTNKTNVTTTTANGRSKNQNIPPWRSYNGPKLYVKPVSRTSNQVIIHKAIAKALEGTANENSLKKIQETIQANLKTSSHFLILFRDYTFKGLYDYNEKLATITKLDGFGPKSICPENIVRFFKYDSTKRAFTEVETKHIGPTIIAISLSTFNTR